MNVNVNVVSVWFFHIMDLSFLLGACCFGLFNGVFSLVYTRTKTKQKLYKLFFCVVLCRIWNQMLSAWGSED